MANRFGKPGEKYGYLSIVKEAERYVSPAGHEKRRVVCECECGSTAIVHLQSLRTGNTVSCGCYGRDRKVTHGLSATPTWQSWRSMCKRCLDPNNSDYHNYGGRGITVCQQWMQSFEAFLEDMGYRPDNCSLDRVDNDGNYEPNNCRWATRSEQQRNRSDNHSLTYNGKTFCIAEWAEVTGLPHWSIRYRIKQGWTVGNALTMPLGTRRRQCRVSQ